MQFKHFKGYFLTLTNLLFPFKGVKDICLIKGLLFRPRDKWNYGDQIPSCSFLHILLNNMQRVQQHSS